jgi:hypothetical protein
VVEKPQKTAKNDQKWPKMSQNRSKMAKKCQKMDFFDFSG